MSHLSRRDFLRNATLAGLGAAGAPHVSLAALIENPATKAPGPARVRVTANGFLIDGKPWPMYSGSFHYWRHDRALWPALFDNISSLGLRTLTTYIPWSVHEMARGQFDFGQVDARKNVAAFLKLAAQKGFKVLVRPGPHINSELTYFGFPRRVVFEEPAQLRTASAGRILITWPTPWPVPSYASDWFFDEVAVYFDALMPILRELLHPHGPIIAIQSDNENSFFFHDGLAYSADYHPDAITAYRRMLERKYGRAIEKLNHLYGTSYKSFSEVEPPREFAAKRKEELPYYLDWAEYRERYLTDSENRVGRMFRHRGIVGIPIFQCTPQGYTTPFNLPKVEEAGALAWSGINLYPCKCDYADEKRQTRAARLLSRFAEIPELGGGIWFYSDWGTRDAQDVEFCSLAAIMHGFKGFNYYMIVERDRWLGSPITRDNRRRPGLYETYRKFIHFVRDQHLENFEKVAPIALLANFDAERLASVYSRRVEGVAPTAWPVVNPRADLGLACGVERYRASLEDFYGALDRSGLGFDFGNTEVARACLRKYRVLGLVTTDFLSREALAKLRDYVRGGGHLVVGPVAPTLGEDLRPNADVAAFFSGGSATGRGSVAVAANAEEFRNHISARAPEPEITRENPAVDIAIHRTGDSLWKLVFLANPTGWPQETRLAFAGSLRFRDLWGKQDLSGTGSVVVSLPAYSVGVWEVLA